MKKIIILVICLAIRSVKGLIAYDCAAANMDISTISLLDVEQCEDQNFNTSSSTTQIQLIQLNEYGEANVIQCKVEISRTIHYCGSSSHISAVSNGIMSYIQEVSRDACKPALLKIV